MTNLANRTKSVGKNVLSYQLNQPLDRFIKEGKFRTSRIEAKYLELPTPLADSIIANWKIGTLKQIMLIKNNQAIGYNKLYEY